MSSVFDNIKSIEFDKNRGKIFGIKSGIIWGHRVDKSMSFPLLYIQKPKAISEKDFENLREQTIQFIQSFLKTVKQSEAEVVACLNLDLFKIGP